MTVPSRTGASPVRAGLAPLLAPVYLPSLGYAAGSSALVPAQVLLALDLGFSPAGVAGLMTWIGAFAIVSSLLAGRLVDRWGEHRALVVITVPGALGLIAAAAAAATDAPGARWVLVLALTAFDLVDAVWSIARQGMVADLAPPQLRGRAMNLYGACQRLGRIVGPVAAAAVLAVAGPAAVLPLSAVIVLAALVWLLRHLPDRHHAEPVPSQAPAAATPTPSRARRALVLLGAGVLILSALRTAKETLLPLWADHGAHLPATQVALVLALASAAELVLFWPAGMASDRYGRAPVVVTAMGLMSAGLVLAPLSSGTPWLLGCVTLIGLGDGAGAGIVKTLGTDIAPTSARATFLGQWQSIASAGSLLAPAVAGAAIAVFSLPAALLLNGVVGLAGTAWMAWWTPRLVPRPGSASTPGG